MRTRERRQLREISLREVCSVAWRIAWRRGVESLGGTEGCYGGEELGG